MTQFVTIDRATLEQLVVALEDSIDCVRHEYETYWGHGLPTRKAQIDCMKESLDRHEASITAGRAALANAEPIGWQAIETAPATANNVLAFSESGSMKIETGFWLLNMLHAANVDGEKCNYTHWMPLPSRPGATL